MNAAFLVALALAGQPSVPASQPSSRPGAGLQPGGTGKDVAGQVTFILELDEGRVKVQESWNFQNDSGRLVGKEHLRFELPAGSRRVSVDENVRGFAATDDGKALYATDAMASGSKTLAAAYFVDTPDAKATWSRMIPVEVAQGRLIIEAVPGLNIATNVRHSRRDTDLNGIQFSVFDFGPVPAGSRFELTFTGIPSKTTLPRTLALLASALIFGWMVYALRGRRDLAAAGSGVMGPLSAAARRDQIVKALEVLERDFKEERVKEKRYQRRHEELMTELATVLHEIEATGRPAH